MKAPNQCEIVLDLSDLYEPSAVGVGRRPEICRIGDRDRWPGARVLVACVENAAAVVLKAQLVQYVLSIGYKLETQRVVRCRDVDASLKCIEAAIDGIANTYVCVVVTCCQAMTGA